MLPVDCVWCRGAGRISAGEMRHGKTVSSWPDHPCPDCGGAGTREPSRRRRWPKN
ncbi:hypothetical protein NY08_562 [Rhodococcus sp. B7740]|nr:hypothetical protein NY08_562 [Rhodococcus sp. B7740]